MNAEVNQQGYPYESGDVLVIGPEVFVSLDRKVISWRGENYYTTSEGITSMASWRFLRRQRRRS